MSGLATRDAKTRHPMTIETTTAEMLPEKKTAASGNKK